MRPKLLWGAGRSLRFIQMGKRGFTYQDNRGGFRGLARPSSTRSDRKAYFGAQNVKSAPYLEQCLTVARLDNLQSKVGTRASIRISF